MELFQTEALIPLGTSLVAALCLLQIRNFRVFPNHRYDGDRRDFGAVGLGAAASATFGTPVGTKLRSKLLGQLLMDVCK